MPRVYTRVGCINQGKVLMQENHGAGGGRLDVRGMAKPDKHPTIFAAYDELAVQESFVLVSDHDPVPLRQEFERDYGPGFDWDYLHQERGDWQIRITTRAAPPLTRVVAFTSTLR